LRDFEEYSVLGVREILRNRA